MSTEPDKHARQSSTVKPALATSNAYPEAAFPSSTIATGDTRILYTLADLDEEARKRINEPDQNNVIQGYLTGIITGVNLLSVHRTRSLYIGPCTGCKTANSSNHARTSCRRCQRIVTLPLNPDIVGSILDETASIGQGQLLLSETAWTDLLGRGPELVGEMTREQMGFVENAVRWQRVTLAFLWTRALGRIAVGRISS